MTAGELIERLTGLVKEQADIIRAQAEALAQLGAEAAEEQTAAAAREQEELLGE